VWLHILGTSLEVLFAGLWVTEAILGPYKGKATLMERIEVVGSFLILSCCLPSG
jgi:hypothetical protein